MLANLVRSSLGTRRLKVIALQVAFSFFLLTIPLATHGAEPELTLIHSDGESIVRIVPNSGKVPLIFHFKGDKSVMFDADVNTFMSTDKLQAVVTIGAQGDANTSGMAQLAFGPGEHRKELELKTAELVSGVEYIGNLTVSAPGLTPKTWIVKLQRPMPRAELTADVNRADLVITINPIMKYFGVFPDSAKFLLTLNEKSGEIPITGLTVRRAAGSELYKDFDLRSNLHFYLDGTEIEDLTIWNSGRSVKHSSLRNIPAGEQRALGVEIANLPRGTHKLAFQINAINAKLDSAPTVELNIHVRHAILPAAAMLLLAIAISFLITKGTINWRHRLKLFKLAQTLDPQWLRDVREMESVVWLKATRRQALVTLEQFSLLPAPQELADRLNTARRLLNLVRRYLDLRAEVESRGFQYMLNFRIENSLEDIAGEIDPEQLNAVNEAALMAKFDTLEKALEDPTGLYKPIVAKARKRVKGAIIVEKLTMIDTQEKQKINKLWEDYVVTAIKDNLTIDELVLVDRVCAAMRVLKRHIEFEDTEVLKRLSLLISKDDPNDIDIALLFTVTNEAVWTKIRRAVEDDKVHISPSEHLPSATPKKALVPMVFDVVFSDSTLNDVFMVKKRMLANWEFELLPKATWKWWVSKSLIPWKTSAVGKKLLQFAPEGGALKTCVTLRWGNNECNTLTGKLSINSSHVNFFSRLFVVQEFVLILVSIAIAFASGLVLYYNSNMSFGSMQDYLALFTWGVGVDQGKNLAQTFQSLSSQSKSADDGV